MNICKKRKRCPAKSVCAVSIPYGGYNCRKFHEAIGATATASKERRTGSAAVWVLEQNMGHGLWEPVLADGEAVAHKNFHQAHASKREIVETWWDLSPKEACENFRISKYARESHDKA